ncbi:Metalloreductase steap2 [Tieghemiomyces parasiticus]|uniref:Metalloreductase steap2 n=1 Tax=Tieghemiomyces parasiticus TaxID=78921 RepID=A0A9W8DPQ5_9FUNG|nr:Metalloreductase steap2 [Tieghemiomyces parasiticus]
MEHPRVCNSCGDDDEVKVITDEKGSLRHRESSMLITPAPQDLSHDTLAPRYPVAVIGAGWYGRALTKRLVQAGYTVHLGRRNPALGREAGFSLPVLPTTYQDAIESAYVVFLTVPCHVHRTFVRQFADALAGKIVVDVSNPCDEFLTLGPTEIRSLAEQLAIGLPASQVVKAFNTVSAYTLEYGLAGVPPQVPVCTDYDEAQREVIIIARALGFIPVDAGTLRMARDVEQANFRFFRGWWGAVTFTVFLFVFFFVYNLVNIHLLSAAIGKNFNDLPLRTMNMIVADVALILLASVNLGGVVANLWQIFVRRRSQRPFPRWLANWLNARKAMGILAFLLLVFHFMDSSVTMGTSNVLNARHGVSSTADKVATGQISAKTQGSVLLGILAFILYGVLCVTSLPTVGSALSWVEWRFIQSTCGWWALTLAAAHTFVLSLSVWKDTHAYPRHMPPSSLLVSLVPMLTILLKLILLIPPVADYLAFIQNHR